MPTRTYIKVGSKRLYYDQFPPETEYRCDHCEEEIAPGEYCYIAGEILYTPPGAKTDRKKISLMTPTRGISYKEELPTMLHKWCIISFVTQKLTERI